MPKPNLNMFAYSVLIFDGQNVLGLISHHANQAWTCVIDCNNMEKKLNKEEKKMLAHLMSSSTKKQRGNHK